LLKRLVSGIILTLIMLGMLTLAVNVRAITMHSSQQIEDWEIEDGGGFYSFEADDTIRLWSNGGGSLGSPITLYKESRPKEDFNVSLEAKAVQMGGFALMLRGSLPFAGSTHGVNFEFGNRDNGTFLLARYAGGWTWTIFATAEEDVWYTMKLSVFKTPFHIMAQVFENNTLLGSLDINDMTNISFESTCYVGFGMWNEGEFHVRNFELSVPNGREPRTWIVDDDGPADFHTIQETINNASDGDTILVRNGTYSGPIVIDKTLTLKGEKRESTIIDGGSNEPSGSIVAVTADNVKIGGFTIQHCRGGGNAIWLDNYVNMTFSDNIITGNNEGIRILHSSGNIISHNVIQDCYYNTGLGFNWAYNNTVYGNIIENCNVGIGGNHWNNTFFENVIRNNKGGWAGWGISDNFQDCVFFHNNIINNTYQVVNSNPSTNIWDNGYPSGGNYWSDYNGLDTNGDGIGDTPYIINAKNRDRYPLMNEVRSPYPPVADFTWAPSTLKVGSPLTFNASSSQPGWNGTHVIPIIEYRWSFGDGNITSTFDPIIVHTYAAPMLFNITLTVFSDGLNSSCSYMIPTKMPTSISISTSSSSTFVGFTVDINGTLCDLYGNGLENEPVVLYYTFSGVTTWFPITSSITDNLGHYYVQWIPYATGYFTIKAEWVGNMTHIGASNNVTLSVIPYENQFVFSVESNSTISALAFNTTNWVLSFTASGPSGTRGYVKVTVAKSLVENITNIRVYLDGNQSEYSITSIDDSWLLTFHYIHSTHQVVVDLDINIIPEFPSTIILPILMILSMLIVIFTKRKIPRKLKA